MLPTLCIYMMHTIFGSVLRPNTQHLEEYFIPCLGPVLVVLKFQSDMDFEQSTTATGKASMIVHAWSTSIFGKRKCEQEVSQAANFIRHVEP